MHHLKDLGCGYKDRICVGIPSFPKTNDIFCNTSPSFRGWRSNSEIYFNNFQNIPTAFQGIIRNTPYIELGIFQHKNTNCILIYDPLVEDGLFDAFSEISAKAEFIEQYGNYNNALQCYASDSIQVQGVLTPSAELNEFAAIPLQAVPTSALAAATQDAMSAKFSLDSACSGFKITVKKLTGSRIRIEVKGGKIYTQTQADGSPVSIDLADAQFTVAGKQKIKNTRVYLDLQYNLQNDTWVGKIQTQSGTTQNAIQVGYKRIPLGTVSYQGKSSKVQQTQCSPVDARDGTDIKSEYQGTAVFVLDKVSGRKKWLPVVQCG